MLQQLRSVLFYVGLFPPTVLFSIIGVLIMPLPRKFRYQVIVRWTRFTVWWLRVSCGLSWRLTGAENIPAAPFVILCKHQSAWETLTLQLIFPPQCQVLKRELLRVPFFLTVSAVAVGVLLMFVRRVEPGQRILLLALGCILGGALGNLVDRMVSGAVTDFLDFHWRGYYWPAFNVADSGITVGMVILLLYSLLARDEVRDATHAT